MAVVENMQMKACLPLKKIKQSQHSCDRVMCTLKTCRNVEHTVTKKPSTSVLRTLLPVLSYLILQNSKPKKPEDRNKCDSPKRMDYRLQWCKCLFQGTICWGAGGARHSAQDLIYELILITLNPVQQ